MSPESRDTRTPLRAGDAAAFLLLRLGVGGVLLWFGAAELHDPGSWSVFFPHGLDAVREPAMFVHATLLFATGALLILGLFQRASAAMASLLLLGVLAALVWNGALDSVFVRDIGLVAAAMALVVSTSAAAAPGLDRVLAHRDGRVRRRTALSTAAVVALSVVGLAATAVPENTSMAQLGGIGGASLFGGTATANTSSDASSVGTSSIGTPMVNAPLNDSPSTNTPLIDTPSTDTPSTDTASTHGTSEERESEEALTDATSKLGTLQALPDVDIDGGDDFGVAAPGSSLSKLGQSGVPGPGNSKH